MADNLVQVTDQNFADTVLKSDKPVVVDFWAAWCRPCLRMAPIFEELATEYAGKMTFAKLDTDANQQTPFKLGIQGIPTLIFFRDGREVHRLVGLDTREALKRNIESVLGAAV